jgi:hypothetical protein
VEVSSRSLLGTAAGSAEHLQPRADSKGYFLVEPPEKGATQLFVIPPIRYAYKDLDDATRKAQYDQFRKDLDREIESQNGLLMTNDVGRIAELFRDGVDSNWLDLEWRTTSAREEKFPQLAFQEQLSYPGNKTIRFFSQGRSG